MRFLRNERGEKRRGEKKHEMMMRLVVAIGLVSAPAPAASQEAPPCTDMMAMQTGWMGGVMDECCDEPTEDCSSG